MKIVMDPLSHREVRGAPQNFFSFFGLEVRILVQSLSGQLLLHRNYVQLQISSRPAQSDIPWRSTKGVGFPAQEGTER